MGSYLPRSSEEKTKGCSVVMVLKINRRTARVAFIWMGSQEMLYRDRKRQVHIRSGHGDEYSGYALYDLDEKFIYKWNFDRKGRVGGF